MALRLLLKSRPQKHEVLGEAGSGAGNHTLKDLGSYLVLSMQVQCNPGCQSKLAGLQLSLLQCKAGETLFIGAQADRFSQGTYLCSSLYTPPSHTPLAEVSACRESGWWKVGGGLHTGH